jgi:putative FmdB family regulatory protein
MPIYEYKCKECDNHFEVMQKVSDDALVKCEKCGGTLEKQWSLSGFQFKGAGWYVTDYAGKKPDTASSDKSKGTPAGSSESKSDSGSESKGEKTSAPQSTPAASDASNTSSTGTKKEN